ncbi:hypothetical protein [Sphingorhabdus sp. Alg239-R122]|uniref:hypothetical protein n=1 Tax=Sphingorhabdus sp. Alg239-R122 TaxID=2305989 RepID=UPI0013DC28CB|nr:hypothetical protein [Sphingorhabdus sp. Alg239-R122]
MSLLPAFLMFLGMLQPFNVVLLNQTEIVTEDRNVVMRDIADISALPPELRAKVANMQILQLPPGSDSFELSERQLAALVRRRVPALHVHYSNGGGHMLRVSVAPGPDAQSGDTNTLCYSLAAAVMGGAIIQRGDVTESACDGRKGPRAVYFDRRHMVLRANGDLNAGTFLGNVRIPAKPVVDRGTDLVFRFRQGPVAVERHVRTIQAGRSGERLFVQAQDGTVMSVPYMASSDDVAGSE